MKKPGILVAVAAASAFLNLSALAGEVQKPAPHPKFPAAISLSDLAQLSGGAGQTIATTEQNLLAISSGNTVNGNSIVTGNLGVSAGAFSGFNGIGNFVFNTGNNNNLQGSLSITIITPPAN